jgi:hypothetical protein
MSLGIYLEENGEEIHWQDITHNLGSMAEEAGIYRILWRAEEEGIETAEQLIGPLAIAIVEMKKDPPRFKEHDSPNGWGIYDHFLPWLERLLCACARYHSAKVKTCR